MPPQPRVDVQPWQSMLTTTPGEQPSRPTSQTNQPASDEPDEHHVPRPVHLEAPSALSVPLPGDHVRVNPVAVHVPGLERPVPARPVYWNNAPDRREGALRAPRPSGLARDESVAVDVLGDSAPRPTEVPDALQVPLPGARDRVVAEVPDALDVPLPGARDRVAADVPDLPPVTLSGAVPEALTPQVPWPAMLAQAPIPEGTSVPVPRNLARSMQAPAEPLVPLPKRIRVDIRFRIPRDPPPIPDDDPRMIRQRR